MKLGIGGFLPSSFVEVTPEALRRVRELGFAGAAFYGPDSPTDVTTEQAREVGRICAEEGVELAEYGQYQRTLVDPEPAIRAANVAALQEAFGVAKALGCPVVITGAGSLSPDGHWFPHPQNRAPETLDRLIGSLREVVRGAEEEGVFLGLECHVATPLYNAAAARMVADAVGSPALKVHLDPVNWMTIDTVYDSGSAITEMVATLGPDLIYGAHSKGVAVESRLVVHLSETYTGAPDDLIDHASVLRELAKLPGDPYLLIEHLPVERMPTARDHLLRIAEKTGVPLKGAEGAR